MKIKHVEGITVSEQGFLRKTILTVRYTADQKGKTLSIADEVLGIQFTVPFEAIEQMTKGKK